MAHPATFKFTKNHEWIDLDGGIGRVGITDYAQKELGDVVFVDFPQVGTKLEAGQSFGVIESVKAASDLYAPVSGQVVAVNESLRATPELVNRDPHGQWIVTIALSNPAEVESLLDADQYSSLVK
jgi:glycine cleavage system H protein